MPRPKVKPQDRQRSVRACDTCKASKKRCDANQPCRLCLKKGTQDTCTYTPTRRERRGRLSQSEASHSSQSQSQQNSQAASGRSAAAAPTRPRSVLDVSSQHRPRAHPFGDPPSPLAQDPQGQCARDQGVDEDIDAESETDYVPDSRNSVERTTQQRPVLLYSSSGDKVFVGNTAALSFLRFLQHTLKHYAGPSGFTDRQHSHNWFEVTDSAPGEAAFCDNLDDDEKNDLIQCFLEVSSGFLDLFSQDELAELTSLTKEGQQPRDKTALASFYLMIAIGCQVRGASRDDLVRASEYFAQGRRLAFEKMLEDATVNLVRAFVLLAFYMFGACRRNSAFMYLGVAAKSADILGLHAAAQNRRMTRAERDSRLRVAKSIRVFDIICSSILGRRGSAPSLRSVDVTSGDMDQEHDGASSCHRALALRATYESCSILETVVGRFADDGALRPSSAEHFLQLLKEWSEVLPVSLRQRPQRGEGEGDQNPPQHHPGYRERMIANVHVAGTYYFGIILVTRQFLIQHVMPQLRGSHGHLNADGRPQQQQQRQQQQQQTAAAAGADAVAELARACVGAATYLAQTCREAVDAAVFRGNMCVVKAWVFAAGLVLGFALLADDAPPAGPWSSSSSSSFLASASARLDGGGDARGAFRDSQHVLSALGRLSAQARQYHGILVAFADAIDKYRRQMRRERHAPRVPFVEQILSYDASSGVGASVSAEEEAAAAAAAAAAAGGGPRRDDGVPVPLPPRHASRGGAGDPMVDTARQVPHAQQPPQGIENPVASQFPAHGGGGGFGVDVEGLPAVGEGGFWNGSDDLSSTSDFLPDHWPSPADNELMLRILWDGYTMSFDDPVPTMPC